MIQFYAGKDLLTWLQNELQFGYVGLQDACKGNVKDAQNTLAEMLDVSLQRPSFCNAVRSELKVSIRNLQAREASNELGELS